MRYRFAVSGHVEIDAPNAAAAEAMMLRQGIPVAFTAFDKGTEAFCFAVPVGKPETVFCTCNKPEMVQQVGVHVTYSVCRSCGKGQEHKNAAL